MKLGVLISCHNRKQATIACLTALFAAASSARVKLSVWLYDDGSADGTSAAIQAHFPEVNLLTGDGSAFWALSMARAESQLLEHGPTDLTHVLWLNDDVILDQDAVVKLKQHSNVTEEAILIGATRDIASGEITYSGFVKNGRHPLSFRMVPPGITALKVDAFNGNFVAVPLATVRLLNGIDGAYSHGFADIDYGLRARENGIPALLMPTTIGTCARNLPRVSQGIGKDWRAFTGPKGGGNFVSVTRYLRRASGKWWWVFLAATYTLWWKRSIVAALKGYIRRRTQREGKS